MSILVTHHRQLAGTQGELLAIEAMYETAKAGHLHGIPLNHKNEVVLAYEGPEPVALIVFDEGKSTGEMWIHLGYCRDEYRRKGHYQACLQRLKDIAAERGFMEIHTHSHPDNTAAIASIMARGGKVEYISFAFPV